MTKLIKTDVTDYLTHIENAEDLLYLRRPLFDVNMRLFKSSPEYNALVLSACSYIKAAALTTLRGYKKPHGMSGANLAVPWNIVAIVRRRNFTDEYAEAYINPVIVSPDIKTAVVDSNCGSIRLTAPIKVRRHTCVTVNYYDENGEFRTVVMCRATGGFTAQHEIDHNLGTLITDREVNN